MRKELIETLKLPCLQAALNPAGKADFLLPLVAEDLDELQKAFRNMEKIEIAGRKFSVSSLVVDVLNKNIEGIIGAVE